MVRVSVIIPCKNAAPRIRECISSVFAQRNVDTQIIVVDDESADDGVAIANEVAKSAGRAITILKGGGKGPAHARNVGLAHADGDYVQWLDADDVLPEEEKLHAQILALRSADDAVAVSDYAWVDFQAKPPQFRPTPVSYSADPLLDVLLGGIPQLGAFLFPSAIAHRLASLGVFTETLRYAEDREYVTLAIMLGRQVVHVPMIGVLYFQWSNAQLSRASDEAAKGDALRAVFDRLNAWGRDLSIDLTEERRYALSQDWTPHRWAVSEVSNEPWWQPTAIVESADRVRVRLSPMEAAIVRGRVLTGAPASLEAHARAACETMAALGYDVLRVRRAMDDLVRRGLLRPQSTK